MYRADEPEVMTSSAAARILTTHPKNHHPRWRERTVLLPGWLDEVRRTWRKPWAYSRRQDLYWGWRLYRASRNFDAVLTGSESAAHVFALLQALARRRKVPHVYLESMWRLEDSPLRFALRRRGYRLVAEAASRVVVYTRRQVELYARVLGVPREKFVFVPSHTTLYGREYPATEGDYVFSGGDSNRDYRTLIEAARGLACRLVIVARFTRHFAGLTIPDNVTILSERPEDEFNRLMAGAAVVVVPLRAGAMESGGRQVFENAMAMGKPVVVADDSGAEDYIAHGITGLLVKPGDPEALRTAIRTVIERPDALRWLGKNAREAAQEYAPERFFERVFRLVDESLEASRDG